MGTCLAIAGLAGMFAAAALATRTNRAPANVVGCGGAMAYMVGRLIGG